MDAKLDAIIILLKSIESRMVNVEEDLKGCKADCKKMNQHIRFVEKTYDIVRTPLNYIKSKIEYMTNCDIAGDELLALTHDDDLDR